MSWNTDNDLWGLGKWTKIMETCRETQENYHYHNREIMFVDKYYKVLLDITMRWWVSLYGKVFEYEREVKKGEREKIGIPRSVSLEEIKETCTIW